MRNTFLHKKLFAESPLSAEESLRLDAALEATQDPSLSSAIRNLGDEEPSLAWRSGLNAKLFAISSKKKARVFWTRLTWATACGCALVLAFSVRPAPPEKSGHSAIVASGSTVEDAIMADHQDAVSQTSLGIFVGYGDSQSAEALFNEPRL